MLRRAARRSRQEGLSRLLLRLCIGERAHDPEEGTSRGARPLLAPHNRWGRSREAAPWWWQRAVGAEPLLGVVTGFRWQV